ncbi:MAG: hypothetical protein MSA21_11315 [Lachnospiraceae bacterium]|nr:hypothetical protein [Lachnospiraceae bacterium]
MSEKSYEDILDKIENIIINLRQGKDRDAYKDINEQMPVINELFVDIIRNINIFKENRIDVSGNIIMMQLENMVDGLENKDDVKLADTLEYEISQTINVYKEIMK